MANEPTEPSDEEIAELEDEEIAELEDEESEDKKEDEEFEQSIRIPPGDQFALGAELTDLDAKSLDPNIFNKDIPTGKLNEWEGRRIQDAIELIQLCKDYGADDFIKFLLVEIHSISMTGKAKSGWLLSTLYSHILRKEIQKVDFPKDLNQQGQQQGGGGWSPFGKK